MELFLWVALIHKFILKGFWEPCEWECMHHKTGFESTTGTCYAMYAGVSIALETRVIDLEKMHFKTVIFNMKTSPALM